MAAVCAPKLLNRETLPTSDTRRLAESYVETFRDAVEAINDFGRGGRETSILYEGHLGWRGADRSRYRVGIIVIGDPLEPRKRRINSEAQVPSRWVPLNAHPPGS